MCTTSSRALLAWYDRHARVLPWRVGPACRRAGVRPDVYGVWVSEIMLQQTTVAVVRAYWPGFMQRWPQVGDLAAADDESVMAAWAGLGYYARARNLLKCARTVVRDHAGVFPPTRQGLLALPGIGPYTSAAIAAIAFDEPVAAVDGNVLRVLARLHRIDTPLPRAKDAIADLAQQMTPRTRAGDYAQAVMDLGASVCTPRVPSCGVCPWGRICRARGAGVQADYPRREPRKTKPTRHGHVYLAHDNRGWIVEQRPQSGLLGGMLGFPCSAWVQVQSPSAVPPFQADWQAIGHVRHTFTHFHLRLEVHLTRTRCLGDYRPIRADDLPTLFRKALHVAQMHLDAART